MLSTDITAHTMSHSDITCSVCKKANRSDVILRHIQNNHPPTAFMTAEQIKYVVKNKEPIAYKKQKGVLEFAYCLICKEGKHIEGKGGLEAINKWIDIHFQTCTDRFEEVRERYGAVKSGGSSTASSSAPSAASSDTEGSATNTVDEAPPPKKYSFEAFLQWYAGEQIRCSKVNHKIVWGTDECNASCKGKASGCNYKPDVSYYSDNTLRGMWKIWATNQVATEVQKAKASRS